MGRRLSFKLRQYLKKDPYLIALLLMSIGLCTFMYFYWIKGHFLLLSAGHLSEYTEYFLMRTSSFQDFLPTRLWDVFPLGNPVVTAHFTQVIFLFFKSYKTLILTKLAFIASSIPVYYLLSRDYTSKFNAFLISILYMASPFTLYVLFSDYKPDFIALPFIFLFFLSFKKRKFPVFLFSALFLALTKQNFYPFLIFFSLYAYFKSKERKYAIYPLVIGAVLFTVYLVIIFQNPGLQDPIADNYGVTAQDIVDEPGLVWQKILKNASGVATLFPYFLFLVLLAPEILFLALPKIMDCLMEKSFYLFSSELIFLMPFVFIGFTHAMARLSRFFKKSKWIKNPELIISMLIIAVLIVQVIAGYPKLTPSIQKNEGNPTLNCGCCNFDDESMKRRYGEISRLMQKVPYGSKIAAPEHIKLFALDSGLELVNLEKAEYIVRDDCIHKCDIYYWCADVYGLGPGEGEQIVQKLGNFSLYIQ